MKIRDITPNDILIYSWLTHEMQNKINTGSPDTSKPSLIVAITTDDDVPVGLMELSSIDFQNKNARFGIMIGAPTGRRFFLGAVKAFLKRCFIDLDLHKIYFRVPADNEHALKVNRYFGFTEEGIDREAVYCSGQFKDIVGFSMTKEEFGRKWNEWD